MHIRKLKLFTDLLTAGDAIGRHLQNSDFSTYLENELLRGFCERKFFIVGLRNRVVHSYDSVDDRLIWDALVNHLPSLLDQVRTPFQNTNLNFPMPSSIKLHTPARSLA